MEPIFNEKVTEKWNLWIRKQCTDVLFMVEKSYGSLNSNRILQNAWKKKKKKKKKTKRRRRRNF